MRGWGRPSRSTPSSYRGRGGCASTIYPKRTARDVPRKDDELNLIRLPLPYDGHFMEMFYKSFPLVRAFLLADAEIPKPVDLPDAEDRLITGQLRERREFPILEVIDALTGMAQPNLVERAEVEDRQINAALSESAGLRAQLPLEGPPDPVSVTPVPRQT